ncbi:MAG: 5-(carboxyamino)imidazole ribonucleotide mutase [Christensenellales bacterium]
MAKAAVIMGSDSDWNVMQNAVKTLKSFEIEVETHIMSAHRTPEKAADFAQKAYENGFGVIIAAAGKAAHLAGVLAGHTILPVIGVPLCSGELGGMDALLATVQMPPGIPVATMAVDGAKNAALMAVQILAGAEPALWDKLAAYKKEMAEGVAAKDEKIQQLAAEL